jgi:hypothetical protein
MIDKQTEICLNKQNRVDMKISIALMSSFVILTIQFLVLILFNLFGNEGALKIQLVSKALVGLVYLFAFPYVMKRSFVNVLIVYSVGIFVFIIQYSFFPFNRSYLNGLVFPVFLMSLPSLIYAMSIRDLTILKIIMRKSSIVVLITGVIISILLIAGISSIGSYSMSLSYYMLLPAVYYLNEILNKYHTKYLILFIISALVIISLGSRGAILCIILFIIMRVIGTAPKVTGKKAYWLYGVFSIGIIVGFFRNSLLMFINNVLLKFGIRSRSVVLFLQGGVYLSGREALYINVIQYLANNPIFGIGIGGDRRLIGSYPHNIILEILANYGLIIGVFISLVLLYFLLKAIFNFKSNETIIMWIALGFVPLLVSQSYLTEMKFWILLGLLFNSRINKKLSC